MALETGGDGLIYVSNYMGKFEVRVKPGTPGSIKREAKGGKEISVMNYTALSGDIVDIKKDVTEKNGIKMVSLKIFLDDYDTVNDKLVHYCLTLPYQSNLVTAFYHMVENIDFNQPVRFSSKHGPDDKGKEKTSLFISQNGENIKWRYTKKWAEENPDAPKKPEWKEITFKGEKVWDNSDEIRFFENILKEKILPPLRGKKADKDAGHAPSLESVLDDMDFPTVEPDNPSVGQPVNEDLPF